LIYMKKLIFILVIGLFLVYGCETSNEDKPKDSEEETGFGGITKQQCNGSGGYWNECGSPCAGTDAEMCIQVCQVQCECGGIAGFSCPKGYKCRLTGKIADERGVCIKE